MSEAVVAGFEDAINAIEPAPIRALLIRTEGPHFMAGADVRMFHERSAADARALFSRVLPVFARLEDLPVPTGAAGPGALLAARARPALWGGPAPARGAGPRPPGGRDTR